jgi:formylglycine-generating enzyme required for sulfatase activity
MVWCNAYSEMSGKEPVYYNTAYTAVLKNSDYTAAGEKVKTVANGYRLPTEAEWEYAARGGGTPSTTGSFVYTYAGSETVGDVAWYDSNSDGTHPVGTKAANTALLYDMSGNVFEWCWDWWRESLFKGTESNPTGPVPNVSRVIRGGSWYNAAPSCAVARRAESYRYRSDGVVGFRVASRP